MIDKNWESQRQHDIEMYSSLIRVFFRKNVWLNEL